MQSASETPSSHLWALVRARRTNGESGAAVTAGRTRAQKAVALRESRRRGIDPPGITSADATLRSVDATINKLARSVRCDCDYLGMTGNLMRHATLAQALRVRTDLPGGL